MDENSSKSLEDDNKKIIDQFISDFTKIKCDVNESDCLNLLISISASLNVAPKEYLDFSSKLLKR